MSFDTIATFGSKWIWDQYGKDLVNKAIGELKKKWGEFHWGNAESNYRTRLSEQHGTTRLLGYPKPIAIEGIFTDIYVLDKQTALRKFELVELQARPFQRKSLPLEKRIPVLDILGNTKRFFILGKPGCGKTTLLKFLTLQACAGRINQTPIFVSLNEWADSDIDLISFITRQFEICAFPDAKAFIEHLLKKGNALVLFDGLDEISETSDLRTSKAKELVNFAKRYPDNTIFLTCRIAAIDYTFEQFTYVEIADFDEQQIHMFVGKWYQDDQSKFTRFFKEFNKSENASLRELGRTPLLLTLLCLAFDETLAFPRRHVDLYREAVEALLKKWDASRGIKRDEIYHKLSSRRKEQLLARLATQNFTEGIYFVRQERFVEQIEDYLRELPASDLANLSPDGEAVLKAIEVQHGLLVECAYHVYSFSHLTFQEYFVARYTVDNVSLGSLDYLFDYMEDSYWYEIFLLVASLLDNADVFFETFFTRLTPLVQNDEPWVTLLRWANHKAELSKQPGPISRATFLFISIILVRIAVIKRAHFEEMTFARYLMYSIRDAFKLVIKLSGALKQPIPHDLHMALDNATSQDVDRFLDPVTLYKLARKLGVELQADDFKVGWDLTHSQLLSLNKYLRISQLFVECLELAAVRNRADLVAQLLLPPELET